MPPYHTAIRAFILAAAHYKCAYREDLIYTGNEEDPDGTLLKFFSEVELNARLVKKL